MAKISFCMAVACAVGWSLSLGAYSYRVDFSELDDVGEAYVVRFGR